METIYNNRQEHHVNDDKKDDKPEEADGIDIEGIDLETKMHYVMQTLRYKIHTLINAWDNRESNDNNIGSDETQRQWVRIISNHIYRFNKMLETALKSYNIEFDAEEYRELEMKYHRELFTGVVATNPLWLSVLMLATNSTNDSNDSLKDSTNDSSTNDSNNNDGPNNSNDSNDGNNGNKTTSVWDDWIDCEYSVGKLKLD